MKEEILQSLQQEVKRLIQLAEDQQKKIEILENEIINKNEQIKYLKDELVELIEKIENFNQLFMKLPMYDGNVKIEESGKENWEE